MKNLSVFVSTKQQLKMVLLASTALIVAQGNVWAADFTVANGVTLTDLGISLPVNGDKGLIEAGGTISDMTMSGVRMIAPDNTALEINGTISVVGDSIYGVEAASTNSTVTGSGLISTNGVGSLGIRSDNSDFVFTFGGTILTKGNLSHGVYSVDAGGGANSDAHITLNGSIVTEGNGSRGIFAEGPDALIMGTGSITTSGGGGAYGIQISGDDAVIDFDGDITTGLSGTYGISVAGPRAKVTFGGTLHTTGSGAHGIASGGNASATEITNNGTITTDGVDANGILVTEANTVIVNAGTINVKGAFTGATQTGGIHVSGAGSTVTNSGSIMASGADVDGIFFDQEVGVVVNSGSIFSTSGHAIKFLGTLNDTLTLQTGNLISGAIDFSDGVDTLNVARGMSLEYTFDKQPEKLNTNGAPSVAIGNTLFVIDPDSFAETEKLGFDAIGGALGLLTSRLNGGTVSGSSAALGYQANAAFPDEELAGPGLENNWWVNGFGSFTKSDSDTEISAVGLVIGADTKLDMDHTFGAFVGMSSARMETTGGASDLDSLSYFGGIYGDYQSWLSYAIVAGSAQHEGKRKILNNLLATGFEYAQADYDGNFVAPELTIKGAGFELGEVSVTPSVRGRYVRQHTDGYTEKVTGTGLVVSARDINMFDVRAQLDFALIDTTQTRLNVQVGVDGRTTSGADKISATLGGTALSFTTGSAAKSSFGGFIGGDLRQQVGENTVLSLQGEIGAGQNVDYHAEIQAGLKIKF